VRGGDKIAHIPRRQIILFLLSVPHFIIRHGVVVQMRSSEMTDPVQAVTPHLVVNDANAAIEFYKKALGATEALRMPAQDGKRLMHAELHLNGSRFFLNDDFPEHRNTYGADAVFPPDQIKGTSVTMHLEVENCDAAVKRAAEAGATVTMPPWDAFWGARYARIIDPFGHSWSFAHALPANASR
jgi:PhnB protein